MIQARNEQGPPLQRLGASVDIAHMQRSNQEYYNMVQSAGISQREASNYATTNMVESQVGNISEREMVNFNE